MKKIELHLSLYQWSLPVASCSTLARARRPEIFNLCRLEWFILCLEIQKLSEYSPSMKLDDYSFELHKERVDKWTLLKSELKVSYLSVVSECVDTWKGG